MSIRNESATPDTSPGVDSPFQALLLEISTACREGRTLAELISLFCKATRGFFALDGVYYWRLADGEQLVGVDADGFQAERFRASTLRMSESAVAVEAVKSRHTVYANHLDPLKYPMAGDFQAKSLMAAPLIVGGDVIGAIVFLSRDDGEHFDEDLAGKATILASYLGSLIETLQRSERHRKRAEDLMALALELSASLRLPEFARSFTERVTGMLGAQAGALALSQGSSLETIVLHEPGEPSDKAQVRRLTAALSDVAAERSSALLQGDAAQLLGPGIAAALGWRDLVVVRLVGADQELLGLLCLANLDHELSQPDRNLLQAVSAHASVALENSRLFSRIAQSNKHWAEIFDSITDFIVVHDDAHRVLRVNLPLAQFIGVRPAELIGVGMRALVSIAADAGDQPCPFCRVGMEKSDEYIHPVLDRTYLVSTSRVRGALNEGLQTIHVLRDITDRREAERRYRELLDNIQEGIFFSTPEGHFVEVNDALVRMLGYDSREQLLQIDIRTELYPEPEQRRRFIEAIEKQGMVRNFEEALRRRDGTLVHTLENAFAVRDAKGVVIQYRGVMLDISEVKAFQAQLQRERDFNTKILNNTQSMILVADTAGLVSYANRRCFEHGNFRESELLGHQLLEFVAPQRREAMAAAFEAVLAGQQVNNLELPMMRPDGKLSQFSINLSPMRDERGEVNSMVAVMTDVTDAAMLQGKLMHAEKMAAVGQLVSGVAHEVNNPLTAILGFADLLLEQEDVPESAHKNLKVIVQEAQRTKTIVQNLLSFARQMPAEHRAVQVNPILRRTLQLRAYDFASHGVDIVERLRDGMPDIVGDAQQLQQVFLNIINNAYDAVRETERRGTIEVETSYVNGGIEVAFRDNGRGIQFPERIFDPFFTTKEVGKGTGLGLSICYGIVREHGGDIICHNNEGRPGATFIVRLPAAAGPAAVAAAAGAQA
ncbi:MAG TPA: PAS domain S-box protein [Terriglobales bacterium]|nr:PAS domain S-box protein [Terriglobales bacterium]